ncbi:MAG: signal recognition particle-docking protein FtsY [Verrucomicrobiota bacterium]
MATWIEALARTRRQIGATLSRMFASADGRDEMPLEALEETLLQADVPVRLVAALLEDLGRSRGGDGRTRQETLRKDLVEALQAPSAGGPGAGVKPVAILVVGVNGCGKTTTCAKLAYDALGRGLKPLLGATDTFRAAGADQLKWWANHLGCEAVIGAPGADAAAVAFDALDAAVARDCDVVIIDTAGRMHTKQPLMQELRKVRAALGKRLSGAPHETWVVLDATLGQNAITQARMFHEAVPLSGAVVAKLDGSSKAGFVFSVARELGIPIRFAGLGEGEADLAPFDAGKFVDALLPAANASGKYES